MKVLVLGGKGFIGRHAVEALDHAGATVTIGTRHPNPAATDFPEEKHVLHQALDANHWRDIADRFDVILNCVGILRQRLGETYDAVHHLGPRAIAAGCRSQGIRFVHVSALGLSIDAKSRFLTSKVRGELAIQEVGGKGLIARLSLLDGDGGYGAAWLRAVSRLPFFFVPTSAKGRIAALTARDAGVALAALCIKSEADLQTGQSKVYELGGTSTASFEDYVHGLGRRYREHKATRIRVPGWLARLAAHAFDLVHFSPFSFGHWELLCRDNVPQPNRLPELLGREPEVVIDG